jgi:hypothetical protein
LTALWTELFIEHRGHRDHRQRQRKVVKRIEAKRIADNCYEYLSQLIFAGHEEEIASKQYFCLCHLMFSVVKHVSSAFHRLAFFLSQPLLFVYIVNFYLFFTSTHATGSLNSDRMMII